MRLRRLLRWWPVPLVVFLIALVYEAWPGRWTFTVSPETTYVTEPVDAEGYVDYPTALNRRLGEGIRPEENANVLIWQALGPHPEGSTMPAEYFTWLGVVPPPEKGEYYLAQDKYFIAEIAKLPNNGPVVKREDQQQQEKWNERVYSARRWPWTADEHPDVADWLKKNEKPLAMIIEASKLPRYFNPLVAKSNSARTTRLYSRLLPNVQACRGIGNALAGRAMLRCGNGDLEGGWQDLLACQRLGRLIAMNGGIIEGLVGTALVAIATNGEIALLGSCKPSAKQLAFWSEELRQLPPIAPLADKFDHVERVFTLDSLSSIIASGSAQLDSINDSSSGNSDKPAFWDRLFTASIDWDQAFRNVNKMYDECAAASRLSDRAACKLEFRRINDAVTAEINAARNLDALDRMNLSRSDRGTHIGNILIGLMLPTLEKLQGSFDRSLQTQRNLQVAVALAAYRMDSGNYPARLDDLAPKYLPVVPGDLFSSQPLIYRPTADGYLLYSVGVNGVDDGGQSIDDEPKGDDIRVRMPSVRPLAKKAE